MPPTDERRLNEIEERLARVEERLLEVERDLSFDAKHDRVTRRFNMWIRIGVYALGLSLILFLFLLMKWNVFVF